MKDSWEGEEFQKFAKNARENLFPKVYESHVVIAFVPGKPESLDAKFAIELGAMVMFDKPILAFIQPGTKIPEKLSRVVDRFVELGDLNDPKEKKRLMDSVNAFAQEFGGKE